MGAIAAFFCPKIERGKHLWVNPAIARGLLAKSPVRKVWTLRRFSKTAQLRQIIWCVEADTIKVETWSKLVSVTLDALFREIFVEMFTA